jgi:hypothetical protein
MTDRDKLSDPDAEWLRQLLENAWEDDLDLSKSVSTMAALEKRRRATAILFNRGLNRNLLHELRMAARAAQRLSARRRNNSEAMKLVGLLEGRAIAELAEHELAIDRINQANVLFRYAIHCSPEIKTYVHERFESHILKYYALGQEQENPSNGYDLPTRVISEAELRAYINEQAALLTARVAQPEDAPFPILSERTVRAIIAHGKKHQWDDRREQGWPYHTNAFVYVHITYRKWVNRGLTREILAWADEPLYAHLNKKISLEGMPGWLDVPSGPEARARAITDPIERTKLEGVREFFRDQKRRTRSRKATPS